MGFRFRKSIRIFPGFRVNLSTRGVSASVGAAPFTLNFSKRGLRSTASMPGTGVAFVQNHGRRPRNSQSPLQPRATIDPYQGDVTLVTRQTRKTLDRYLALQVRDVREEERGLRYAFDIRCTACGGSEIEAPDGLEDHHVAYCRGCKIKLGMMGEIRAYTHEKAAALFAETQVRNAAATSASRRRTVRRVLAASTAGLVGLAWLGSRSPPTPQVPVAPLAAYSDPSPVPTIPPPAVADAPASQHVTYRGGQEPVLMLAPLPPARPPSLASR